MAGNQAKERRLARAVGADQRMTFALGNRQVDSAQHLCFAKTLRYTKQFKRWVHVADPSERSHCNVPPSTTQASERSHGPASWPSSMKPATCASPSPLLSNCSA